MKSVLFWQTPLLLVLVYFLSSHGQTVQTQGKQPTVRVNVERVNVGAVVTHMGGNFVEGLRREDFRVFDNAVEQPLTGFATFAEPAKVLLLIESGPAVLFLGKEHIRAADTLLKSLSPDDQVAIAAYSRSPELLFDFTPDKPTARLALANLNFMAGFGDLNLSSSIASAMDWLTTLPGKKTLVVLSTGLDTTPPQQWQRIQQKLKTSDVRILAVSLSGDFRKPPRHRKLSPDEREDQKFVKKGFAAGDVSLREVSEATGGRAYFPKNQKEFDRTYAEIAQLVRHEYSLAFTPPAHDGQVHAIQVKVKRLWCRVDHRRAYLAPAAAQR